jgi:hypothetical protein
MLQNIKLLIAIYWIIGFFFNIDEIYWGVSFYLQVQINPMEISDSVHKVKLYRSQLPEGHDLGRQLL